MWGHASEAPSNLSLPQAGATSASTALNPDLSGSCSAGRDTLPSLRNQSLLRKADMTEELHEHTYMYKCQSCHTGRNKQQWQRACPCTLVRQWPCGHIWVFPPSPKAAANTSLVPGLQSPSGHKHSSGRGWQWMYRNVRNMVHMEQSSCEFPRLPAHCGSDTS